MRSRARGGDKVVWEASVLEAEGLFWGGADIYESGW